jgi:chromosome segregation ATPase
MTTHLSTTLRDLQNLQGSLREANRSLEQAKKEYSESLEKALFQYGASDFPDLVAKRESLLSECERMTDEIKESIDEIGI